MKQNLIQFGKIADHLVYLTTYDSYGSSRSRGISTYSELAEELNSVGIVPKRGSWTQHSLECFFARCRSTYDKATLMECCDLSTVGVSNWEYISGKPKRTATRSKMNSYSPSSKADLSNIEQFTYTESERWKEHEEPELFIDRARLIKREKNAKLLSKFESIQRKVA